MRVNDPDARLMLRVKDGDDTAFDIILEKYQKPIINFVYHFINNRAEAEELAQDVFLRVYAARANYQPEAKFATWIYKIATNLCLKKLNQERISTRLRVNIDGEHISELRDARPNIQEVLEAEEKEEVIAKAINGLPRNEKTAILLRKREALSYKEIADVIGCTEGAVKTYIHRAKLRLRERLSPYLEGKLK